MPLHPKVLLQGDTPSAYSNFQFKVWDQCLQEGNKRTGDTPLEYYQATLPQYHAAHIYSFNSTEQKFGIFGQCISSRDYKTDNDYEMHESHGILTCQCDEPKIPANFNCHLYAMGDASFLGFESASNTEILPKLYHNIYRWCTSSFSHISTYMYRNFGITNTNAASLAGAVFDIHGYFYSPLADNMFSNLPLMVDYENNGYSLGIWQEEAAGLPPSFFWNFK